MRPAWVALGRPDKCGSTGYLWVTMILCAVAVLQPNLQINLMGVIPIKLYWLALFDGGVILIDFIQLTRAHFLLGFALLLALSNFLLVFGPSTYRLMRQRGEVAVRRIVLHRSARQFSRKSPFIHSLFSLPELDPYEPRSCDP